MVFCRLFENNKQKYGANKTTSPWQRYQGLVVCLLLIILSLYVSGFRFRLRALLTLCLIKPGMVP